MLHCLLHILIKMISYTAKQETDNILSIHIKHLTKYPAKMCPKKEMYIQFLRARIKIIAKASDFLLEVAISCRMFPPLQELVSCKPSE